MDVDNNLIAPLGPDGRARILVVDLQAKPLAVAVRVARRVGDRQVVGDGFASSRVLQIEVSGNAEPILPARSAERTIGAGGILGLTFLKGVFRNSRDHRCGCQRGQCQKALACKM